MERSWESGPVRSGRVAARGTGLLVLILTSLTGPGVAQGRAQTAGPTGVWYARAVVDQPVRGTLRIDGRAEPWTAQVAGYRVGVRRAGDTVALELPGEVGSLTARLGSGGSIVGHWVQPALATRGVRYASPVHLHPSLDGVQVWSGAIRPLEEAVTLYLSVSTDPAGRMSAFFRNPELNLGMGRAYEVRVEDARVLLVNRNDTADVLEGEYDGAAGALSLSVPWIPERVRFRRHDTTGSPGFYPRGRPVGEYSYREPLPMDDGWPIASLERTGLDRPVVQAFVRRLATQPVDSYASPYVHGVLVARHGSLVLEEYFHGYGPDQLHDTRSAGKSFAPLLVGAAHAVTAELEPSTRISSLLTRYRPFAGGDPRKEEITLHHLMSMTSGLACDDNDPSSPGSEDRMQAQREDPDWHRYTMDLPMARRPGGEAAVYCTAGINLLGAAIASATGTWLPDFFQRRVAGPLGFRGYHLNLMPTGQAYLGGGVFLYPRDLLKLGQLYLDGGEWAGTRVVPERWVRASTRRQAGFDQGHGYGYGWHLREMDVGGRSVRLYSAEGNGGQLLMVFPELDLVVLMTGGNYGNYPTWIGFQELVARHLLPAAFPERR